MSIEFGRVALRQCCEEMNCRKFLPLENHIFADKRFEVKPKHLSVSVRVVFVAYPIIEIEAIDENCDSNWIAHEKYLIKMKIKKANRSPPWAAEAGMLYI